MSDKTSGFVYCLTHPVWNRIGGTGAVKIGMTVNNPAKRLAEITNSSGLLAPGRVEFCLWVSDRRRVEKATHDILRHKRVRRRRELFRCTAEEARAAIERAAVGIDSAPWTIGRPEPRRANTRSSYSQRRFWPASRHLRRRGMFEVKAFVFGLLALAVVALANGWIR